MAPKISIIITCFNYGRYLTECIESCLNSWYKNQELIVIDDNSSDETAQILETCKSRYANVSFIKKDENKWVSHSRNLWASLAKWEYILFMDADDLLNHWTVEKAIDILEADSNTDIVYADYEMFWTTSSICKTPPFDKKRLYARNYMLCSSVFRKKISEEISFDEDRRNKFEDWDFWLTAIEFWYTAKRGDFIGIKYRQHEQSRNFGALKQYITNMAYIGIKHRSLTIMIGAIKWWLSRWCIEQSKNLWVYNWISPIWRKHILRKNI